jgi:hypothetical protein
MSYIGNDKFRVVIGNDINVFPIQSSKERKGLMQNHMLLIYKAEYVMYKNVRTSSIR